MSVTQETMQKIQRAMEFGYFIDGEMARSFPVVAQGMELARENSNIAKDSTVQNEANTLLSGAMIVYLFSVWDTYFEHQDISTYFRPDEQQLFYAFKHIRIVFAHNILGDRKGNRAGQDRMDHAEKLDAVMASEHPIESIVSTHDSIELAFPDAFLDCQNFLAAMSRKLACGRFSVGGAFGKVRSTSGESEVL